MKNDKYNISDLLWLCQRAVEDAIYCEDGLDGAIGVDVIKEIKKYRKEHKLK